MWHADTIFRAVGINPRTAQERVELLFIAGFRNHMSQRLREHEKLFLRMLGSMCEGLFLSCPSISSPVPLAPFSEQCNCLDQYFSLAQQWCFVILCGATCYFINGARQGEKC